jgi:hypothetical protein
VFQFAGVGDGVVNLFVTKEDRIVEFTPVIASLLG